MSSVKHLQAKQETLNPIKFLTLNRKRKEILKGRFVNFLL